jgi:hypothetical protein
MSYQSENKTKTDFITVLSTGMIGKDAKDFTQDAFNYAKMDQIILDKWVSTDPVFAEVYQEVRKQTGSVIGRTLQQHMVYVNGLRNRLLNRPDIIDVSFSIIKE